VHLVERPQEPTRVQVSRRKKLRPKIVAANNRHHAIPWFPFLPLSTIPSLFLLVGHHVTPKKETSKEINIYAGLPPGIRSETASEPVIGRVTLGASLRSDWSPAMTTYSRCCQEKSNHVSPFPCRFEQCQHRVVERYLNCIALLLYLHFLNHVARVGLLPQIEAVHTHWTELRKTAGWKQVPAQQFSSHDPWILPFSLYEEIDTRPYHPHTWI
jgi:hypothetical protein